MKNNITDIRQEPLNDGKFIQTSRLKYKQNGIEKEWEMVKAHDSVAILIYHKIKKSFVLVGNFVLLYISMTIKIVQPNCVRA